ncbi:MAG: SH3 domain-containing protein [Litoreibacter sp.]|nr:SH3 domain-containing protein [Litoreibacter sp.]
MNDVGLRTYDKMTCASRHCDIQIACIHLVGVNDNGNVCFKAFGCRLIASQNACELIPHTSASYGVGTMPFSEERTAEIQTRIRSRLEKQNVNVWERSFLTNIGLKFAKDGTRTRLSKAQYAKLHKILGLERETKELPIRAPTPTKSVRRSSRSVQNQNPIKATRRALNAPRRAVRRVQRQLTMPIIIVVALFTLIGSLTNQGGNTSASSGTHPTTTNVPREAHAFVTGSSVNQRQRPSTSYAVIGSLTEGTRVKVLSQNGQWTQVRSTLGDGWMASRFLSSGRPAEQAAPEGTIRASAVRIVDGDTIKYGGLSIRLTGFDTPETYYADCAAEKARGDAATARLRQLIRSATTLQLFLRDERDRYGRGLGSLLVNGQDVGDVLISEGLARRYSGGRRQGWC